MKRAFETIAQWVVGTVSVVALGLVTVTALAFAGARRTVREIPRAVYVLGPPLVTVALAYVVFDGWTIPLVTFIGTYLVWTGKIALRETERVDGYRRR